MQVLKAAINDWIAVFRDERMWSCHCHTESYIDNLSAAAVVMLAQQTIGRHPALDVLLGGQGEIRELISSS